MNNINHHWEGVAKGKSPKENNEKLILLLEPHLTQTIPIVLHILPNSKQSSQYVYQFPSLLKSNLAGKQKGEIMIQASGHDAPIYNPEDCSNPIHGGVIIPETLQEQETIFVKNSMMQLSSLTTNSNVDVDSVLPEPYLNN